NIDQLVVQHKTVNIALRRVVLFIYQQQVRIFINK
ncbi:unnamed protein product, partial [Rotaria sordida]